MSITNDHQLEMKQERQLNKTFSGIQKTASKQIHMNNRIKICWLSKDAFKQTSHGFSIKEGISITNNGKMILNKTFSHQMNMISMILWSLEGSPPLQITPK